MDANDISLFYAQLKELAVPKSLVVGTGNYQIHCKTMTRKLMLNIGVTRERYLCEFSVETRLNGNC